MFKSVVKVVSKVDKMKDITLGLQDLKHIDVLVGIPQKNSSRQQAGLTNAELGYILAEGVHDTSTQKGVKQMVQQGSTYEAAMEAWRLAHGDPLYNIPPRPFLEPSIEHNIEKIIKQQTKIINKALEGDRSALELEINKLGMLAQNIVRDWFTNPANKWPPNAPATIAKKKSSNPLIDTGQLRRSVTYVVVKK